MSINIDDLITQLRNGNRRAVARLMSLVEEDAKLAREIIRKIHPYTGKSYIIGITGAPGVGKSSIVNALIGNYLTQGLKVGVIMVDPSSPFTGGALLGDRIRMKSHFSDDHLFIRSMASRGYLGGLALATRDLLEILDAFGCDIIIIETVGVGQSEIDIFKIAYTIVLILIPELGDDIQAIKAGVLEITDIFVVNKMDLPGADKQVMDLENMLDLGEKLVVSSSHKTEIVRSEGWRPPIVKANAKSGENIPLLIEKIEEHKKYLTQSHIFEDRLKLRYLEEIKTILKHVLSEKVEEYLDQTQINDVLLKVLKKNQDPYTSADEILKDFKIQ